MIARVKIGGVWVHFGYPQSLSQPSPFYAYLVSMDPIADATGEETGSTAFVLSLKAQELLGLNLRSEVEILDAGGFLAFSGVIGGLTYTEDLRVTVEA